MEIDMKGPLKVLKMSLFGNMSKDKGKTVLPFSQTFVIKKPIYSLSFIHCNHKIPRFTMR